MLRFCSLASGSTGNATLVEASGGITSTRLLVDCGLSQRELAKRLAEHGSSVEAIDAIFITHEHGDHIGCSLALAQRHRLPIWMSRGTWRAVSARAEGLDTNLLNFSKDGVELALGDLSVRPYHVPHDANEPLQLTVSDGASRLGILTDAGSCTAIMVEHLAACQALLLECNHDTDLLANGTYPPRLQARIRGTHGHLSNTQAAQVLANVWQRKNHAGLQHLVAAHLSEQNNRPSLARAALAAVIACDEAEIGVADPILGCAWRTLS